MNSLRPVYCSVMCILAVHIMTERKKRTRRHEEVSNCTPEDDPGPAHQETSELRPALRKLQDNNQTERSETRDIEEYLSQSRDPKDNTSKQAELEEHPRPTTSGLNMPKDTESGITCSKSADVAQEIAANTMNVKEDIKRVEKLLNNCQIENPSHYESLAFILTRIDSSMDTISLYHELVILE